MPDMGTSRVLATFSLQHPRAPIIPASEWLKLWGLHRAATGGVRLFDLDPGVLDHLAPALLLAAKISVERFGRLRDHYEALVHAEPLEVLRLHRSRGRFVQAVDDFGRRFGRRGPAIT